MQTCREIEKNVSWERHKDKIIKVKELMKEIRKH